MAFPFLCPKARKIRTISTDLKRTISLNGRPGSIHSPLLKYSSHHLVSALPIALFFSVRRPFPTQFSLPYTFALKLSPAPSLNMEALSLILPFVLFSLFLVHLHHINYRLHFQFPMCPIHTSSK